MTKQEIAREIEGLTFQLWTIKSLAVCSEQAIFQGSLDVSEYEGSYHILTTMLHDFYKNMEMLKNKAFCEVNSNETN